MKGGFSDRVFHSHAVQQAILANADDKPFIGGGYLASTQRTPERDQYLEYALAKTGLGPNGIGMWLTSGDARHLMDNVTEQTSLRRFKVIVNREVKTAFLKVTLWSHPDHHGRVGDTERLLAHLKEALVNV